MNFRIQFIHAIFSFTALSVTAQGTFVYDQQSSTDDTPFPGSGGIMQQVVPPWGQSFTPGLAEVGFIRLKLNDFTPGNDLGATLFVNLLSGSIDGTIIGTSIPVTLTDGFAGTVNFFFDQPVSITPDQMYYFSPVVQTGDSWLINGQEETYPGGTAFSDGISRFGNDLWFREGIVVPEPSSALLLLMGGSIVVLRRKKFFK